MTRRSKSLRDAYFRRPRLVTPPSIIIFYVCNNMPVVCSMAALASTQAIHGANYQLS